MSELNSSRRFGCPSCGGGLRYDIVSGKMKCDRCDGLTEVSALRDELPSGAAGQETMEVTEFHCPQCGAMVYSTDTSATGFCSFCGSDVVLTGRLGRARRPAKIVPFTVSREQCEAAYRKHLKHYYLMPGALKSAETISHFRPVYVPFWSYSVHASGAAELKGKKSYTSGKYHYNEEYDLSMHADIDQKNILYDASTAFEDDTSAMLQHTSEDAVPFHSAYLSGFYAQAADVPAETYQDEAAATAVRMFMDRVREQYVMDSVEMAGDIEHSFGLPDARFEQQLIMMPVWLLACRQGERVIYTAVNGRTGQVVCDVPVSSGKVLGVTAVLAAGLFALLQLFLTLKPVPLMLLCAVLLLVTQFLLSGALSVLRDRITRAWEPDFSGGRATFTGPAQALLKRKGNTIAKVSASPLKKASTWVTYAFYALVIVACLLIIRGEGLKSIVSEFTPGSLQWLPTLVMAIILVIMVIQVIRHAREESRLYLLPGILSCLACAAGIFFLLSGENEDLVYYGCSAAMLAAALLQLILVNRSHNEFASRPVPFFGNQEDQA